MMMIISIIATIMIMITTTTTTAYSTTIASPPPLSGIKLSSQPIYQESTPPGSVTPINQTHIAATHTGNGTLTLPNSNQTINTISNGTAIASLATPSAIAKTIIRAPNGETATITIYEIIQFNNPAEAPLGGGKGIKIIIFHTNSTGMLAPLDGVIAAGINDIQPNGESELTAWRWESGIPLPTTAIDETTDQQGATTQATNVTTEGGGEEEEEAAVANQPPVTTSSPSELQQAPVEQSQSFAEEQLPDTSEEVLVEEQVEEEEEQEEEETECHPSYPDFCIPPPPPNLNCNDISERRFTVLSPDPHGLDGNDNDGIGCES
jgi:hypothetical protein